MRAFLYVTGIWKPGHYFLYLLIDDFYQLVKHTFLSEDIIRKLKDAHMQFSNKVRLINKGQKLLQWKKELIDMHNKKYGKNPIHRL